MNKLRMYQIVIVALVLLDGWEYFELHHGPRGRKYALANCTFDAGGVMANHYVTNSTTVAGACADTHVRVDVDPPKNVNIIGVSVDTAGPSMKAKILLDQGEDK